MDRWQLASEIAEHVNKSGHIEISTEQLTSEIYDIINEHIENY